MSNLLQKYAYPLTGIVIGAMAGYAYWYFIGCTGDVCPIYSVWYRSTAYGAVMGGLLGSVVQDVITSWRKRKNAEVQE
jgi:hypothetical protein